MSADLRTVALRAMRKVHDDTPTGHAASGACHTCEVAVDAILPKVLAAHALQIAKAINDEGEFADWHERNSRRLWPTNLETVEAFVAERFGGRKYR